MTENHPEISKVHLAMFAKYWEIGKVKTRLAKSIGEEAAQRYSFVIREISPGEIRGFRELKISGW